MVKQDGANQGSRDERAKREDATYQRRLIYTVLVAGLFAGLIPLYLAYRRRAAARLYRSLTRHLAADARSPLTRRTPLPASASLAAVIVLLVALFGAGGTLLAPQLADQISGLVEQLPEAVNEVQRSLNNTLGRSRS